MANAQMGEVARQFRLIFEGGTVAGLSEGELLARFVATGDETAFEALVTRHGPMVRAVCRRLLAEPSDVDDAFQATFLVLVRRAGSIRDRDRLAGWLYGVAHRVAAKARTDSAIRRARERQGADRMTDPVFERSPHDDFAPTLHEEVNRLPEKFRAAVILCDLEGHTQEEAARMLRWPVGSVKGRLHRARNLLRDRLVRRGVTLSAGMISLVLGGEVRASIVSHALVNSTVKAAMSVAVGKAVATGLVSAAAVTLYEGVVNTMIVTKLKITATLVVAGTFIAGSGVMAYQFGAGGAGGTGAAVTSPDRSPAPSASADSRVAFTGDEAKADEEDSTPQDTEIADATAWRVSAAKGLYEASLATYKQGRITIDRVIEASRQLFGAERDSTDSRSKQLQYARNYVERMKNLSDVEKAKRNTGTGSRLDEAATEFALADARAMELQMGNSPTPPSSAARASKGIESTKARDAMMQNMMTMRLSGGMMPGMMPMPGMAKGASVKGGMMGPADMSGMSAGGMPGMGMPGMMGGGSMNGGMMGLGGAAGTMPAMMGAGGTMPRVVRQDRSFDEEDEEDVKRNEVIREALGKALPMHFPEPTPLEDVIKHIRTATESKELPHGLPIYVDPYWLEESGLTMASPVTFEIEDVRLKTSLRLILRQLQLGYFVRDGVIVVTALMSQEYRAAHPNEPGRGVAAVRGGFGGTSAMMPGMMGGGQIQTAQPKAKKAKTEDSEKKTEENSTP